MKRAMASAVVAVAVALHFQSAPASSSALRHTTPSDTTEAGNRLAELKGVWVGPLSVGGAELRIAIQIDVDGDDVAASLRSIDQSNQDFPAERARFNGQSLMLEIPSLGVEIEGPVDVEGGIIAAEFRQRGARLPLTLSLVDSLPVVDRPQEPKRPFPYEEDEISYDNPTAGVTLAATLTLPRGEGPFPAVVLLTGSGPQDRNAEIFGHKPFLVLADYLTRQGIAVLRADDRSVGGSSGDFAVSTTGDFADDALAGRAYLSMRTEIDSRRIGFIGHSEGTMIALIAAAREPDAVAFIVLMAGVGAPLVENVLFQREMALEQAGLPSDEVAFRQAFFRRIYQISAEQTTHEEARNRIHEHWDELGSDGQDRLGFGTAGLDNIATQVLAPWWRFALAFDPVQTLARVKCPVLAVTGGLDQQTPADLNLEPYRTTLRDAGVAGSEVRQLDGLNHLMQTAETGAANEYGKIEETISPIALETVAQWITQTVRE